MKPVWPNDLVAVAEVICPQGNKGEVKALALTGSPERFATLRTLTAWRDGARLTLTLTAWRQWRGYLVLGFAEASNIDAAESLRGSLLCINAAERAALPQDQFYQDDLLGLSVVTEDGDPVGRLISISATGANDVFEIRDAQGREFYIPAIRSVVVRVDLAARVMVIRPIPGLLDEGQ